MVLLERKLSPLALGFDKFFDDIFRVVDKNELSYPPFNISKSQDGLKYTIEMAVAGFSKDELDITLSNETSAEQKLIIKGKKEKSTETNLPDFVYRGLSTRSFSKEFNISNNYEIESVNLENGLLYINLEAKPEIRPEIKKIEIKTTWQIQNIVVHF